MLHDAKHRLLSEPVPVRWAGFESDTYRLQRDGWSLAAEQDICTMRMRLAIKHQGAQMYGVSQPVEWHYLEFAKQGFGRTFPTIHFNMIGKEIRYTMMGRTEPWNFQAIDAVPQFVETEVKTLNDLVHFAPCLVRTREIILPEETVPELMEKILKLQQPGREEELKRQLEADRRGMAIDATPRQKFHAQILSIAA